jgi:hypothetical protein
MCASGAHVRVHVHVHMPRAFLLWLYAQCVFGWTEFTVIVVSLRVVTGCCKTNSALIPVALFISACAFTPMLTQKTLLQNLFEHLFEQVCYSWWCLSCLSILGRLHWIDGDALGRFILHCQVCAGTSSVQLSSHLPLRFNINRRCISGDCIALPPQPLLLLTTSADAAAAHHGACVLHAGRG